jgi:hypothetical protein
MLRMLYRCKLGRPGKMQEINSVYIRTYENGIVAVNPTKETQTVLFQAPSEFSICDVCTGACASFEKGKLKIEIPSHSGQIYLKRRNLLTNYLLEAQCLAVQTKGNKDLRRELQDKITEALFALKNSNARENESNNLINLSDSLLDICDKIRFSANPKNKFIEAQEKENHPPSASISDSLDICIRKFWMNLHGINISWFSDGKLVPGKKSTLKMKILAQKTPVEFSLSFPETKFLKISPQKTERKVQKEKAAYEEFSIELKDQDISPKVIFISPAIHIKMQGREKAVFYSDFIEFEINHTSFRKSFTTGICDELDLGYDFNLTGEAGKAFNISVNLNCVGGSTKDNDYLNDFSIALRKKGEKNEIILPVFEKETIGSKNISQAKFKKTVAWTPDSPGTYELGFQYKYTDPDHLDKANKTLTTYWLKEPTIKIDKPLYQEGNIP